MNFLMKFLSITYSPFTYFFVNLLRFGLIFFVVLFVMRHIGVSKKWQRTAACFITAIYAVCCFNHYVLIPSLSFCIGKFGRDAVNIAIPNVDFVVWVLAFFGTKAITAYFLNRKMWKQFAEEGLSFRDFLEKSTGSRNMFCYNFRNELVETESTDESEASE